MTTIRAGGSPATVLRTVLDHGPIARSTIARLTGLSPATVTTTSNRLIDRGLLRERPTVVAVGSRRMGRPHVPIDIADEPMVCGIHLSLTHITVSLVDLRGRVIATDRHAHRGQPPNTVLDVAVELMTELTADRASRVLGIGFAVGGWVDPDRGIVVEHPLTCWNGVAVRELLEHRTGFDVHVDSHVRALVDAECLFGEPRARRSVVQLFVGNVIDAAFATDGLVHAGPGSAAGAVAHMPIEHSTEHCSCGRTGCFQATLSERVLVRDAVRRGIIEVPDFGVLLAAAESGNPSATQLLVDRSYRVGLVSGSLLDILNPEVFIVCDPGMHVLPECLDAVRAGVAESSYGRRDVVDSVLPSSFHGRLLPVAGGASMLGKLYRDPLEQLTGQLAPAL
ncbi:ROK family transcriptional regulator [Rhodococcoides yunnanense]|uniref:ROK family transcriptional regulator n=1 Tax=Rhodococcoides yunnanense TaxID=278209 RepID=UPI00093458E0|nr:ROK family transcriptional regulator [Rhodococcus yunnanensis]